MQDSLDDLLPELSKLGRFNILEKVVVSLDQEFEGVANMFVFEHRLIVMC